MAYFSHNSVSSIYAAALKIVSQVATHINESMKKLVRIVNRVFSCDVTGAMLGAMLVSLNRGTAALLVSPTNPLGIELYSYANVLFCFG